MLGTLTVDETYVAGIEEGVHGREMHTTSIVAIAVEALWPKGSGACD